MQHITRRGRGGGRGRGQGGRGGGDLGGGGGILRTERLKVLHFSQAATSFFAFRFEGKPYFG